jgi:thiamine-phosphate pyrophosphorylase
MWGMAHRQLPVLWLMTDPELCAGPEVLRTLPRGAGVIFRHYDVPGRARLARSWRALAKAQNLVFLVAGDPRLAAAINADGFHAPEALIHRTATARRLMPWAIVTAAAHGPPGLVAAAQAGADAVLVSPVFATRSHPGAQPLGVVRFAALAQAAGLPVIALGGMNAATFPRLAGTPAIGFAAIDAFRSRPRIP